MINPHGGPNKIWLWRHPGWAIIITLLVSCVPVIGLFCGFIIVAIMLLAYPGAD